MVPVLEDHDHVHLKLNLERRVNVGRTRVDLREEHVQGNLKARNRIAISHLDILHFGRVCLILKSFGAHKLNLDRFDLQLARLTHDVALEWVCVTAVDAVDLAVELELRQLLRWRGQVVRTDDEVLLFKPSAKSLINTAALDLAVVLGLTINCLTPVLWSYRQGYLVDYAEVDPDVSINQLFAISCNQLILKLERLNLIKPPRTIEILFMLHEIDTIFLRQGWAALVASNLRHCVHVSLGCQRIACILEGLAAVFDRRCASDCLPWLVEFACAGVNHFQLGAAGRRCYLFRHLMLSNLIKQMKSRTNHKAKHSQLSQSSCTPTQSP